MFDMLTADDSSEAQANCIRRTGLTGESWRVRYTVALDATGLVSADASGSDTPIPAPLARCLTAVLRSAEWPPTPAGATVTLDLGLAAGGEPTSP